MELIFRVTMFNNSSRSLTSTYFICSGCQLFCGQPLAKVVEQKSDKSENSNVLFKIQAGPPVSNQCPECGSCLHVSITSIRRRTHSDQPQVAGPMWNSAIHNVDFVTAVLHHVESDPSRYGTSTRIKGMLTIASEVTISGNF